MTIDELQLAPHVRVNAEALYTEFGDVIQWTSGYRDLLSQARAMASNVIKRRTWIKETYTRTGRPSFGVALRLQAWVDQNPHFTSLTTLASGLHAQLLLIPGSSKISFHTWTINGQPASLAFDLEPIEEGGKITAMGQEVWNRILTLPYLDPPPMRREGGLPRWHAQFKPIDMSTSI
jgi:hypothetical protein